MKITNKQLATQFIASVESCDPKDLEAASDVLVAWLAARGELKRFREIIRAIDHVWKEKHGVATLTIETAYPLPAAMRSILEKQTAGAEIRERVDASLIGGARIRIDEMLIDGSISGALKQLTHAFEK